MSKRKPDWYITKWENGIWLLENRTRDNPRAPRESISWHGFAEFYDYKLAKSTVEWLNHHPNSTSIVEHSRPEE